MADIVSEVLKLIEAMSDKNWTYSSEYDIIAIRIPEFYCVIKYEFDFFNELGKFTVVINNESEVWVYSDYKLYGSLKSLFDRIAYKSLDLSQVIVNYCN